LVVLRKAIAFWLRARLSRSLYWVDRIGSGLSSADDIDDIFFADKRIGVAMSTGRACSSPELSNSASLRNIRGSPSSGAVRMHRVSSEDEDGCRYAGRLNCARRQRFRSSFKT